jgi:hypothetical protein
MHQHMDPNIENEGNRRTSRDGAYAPGTEKQKLANSSVLSVCTEYGERKGNDK